MNDIAEKNEVSLLQLVLFSLGSELYSVNVMQVQEVLRVTDIAPVPGAPNDIIGIINLRGNVVTVIDARIRFGLVPKETDDRSRIIIVESEEETTGILVDSVVEVIDLDPSTIESTPKVNNEDSSKYIRGVSSYGGKLFILVNLQTFLNDEEIMEVEIF